MTTAPTSTVTSEAHGRTSFAPSGKAKEAIKVGIAIVITYGLALRFDWMSATWAGIAVAMISQPGEGQSLYKGVLRALGTFLAFFSGLILLALFPQDRWMLFVAASPVLGYYAYRMKGQNDYLWFVAAFVTVMILTAGPSKPGYAFEFAAYRTMETLMGIGVWALVSSLLWPVTNLGTLRSATGKLLTAQRQVIDAVHTALVGSDSAGVPPALQTEEAQLVTQVGSLIDVAAAETYEVRGVRPAWTRLHGASLSFMLTSNRLQSSVADLQHIDIEAVLPGLGEFLAELGARFAEAQSLLDGKPPVRPCQQVSLELARDGLKGLDHFECAVVEVTRTEFEALEAESAKIVASLQDIMGHEPVESGNMPADKPDLTSGPVGLRSIDRDQLLAAAVVVTSFWVSALIWIYINPPGGVTWTQFVPTLVLAALRNPQVRFFPMSAFAYAYGFGIVAYVFVMPHLSGFAQLGLLLFSFAFFADYYFTAARNPLMLAMFSMLGITNQQTYDFASTANTYVFTLLGIAVAYALTYMIGSPRPEKVLLKQIARFFRSADFLLSPLSRSRSFVERSKQAYYAQELRTLPQEMSTWGKRIDPKRFPKNSPDQIAELTGVLQVLSYRTEDLLEARGEPQSDLLARELSDDVRRWRETVERAFRQWADVPEADPGVDLEARVSERLARLNDRIEETLNRVDLGEISDAERRNFYRLLGTYRCVTSAGMAYAKQARAIDWAEWREERFE